MGLMKNLESGEPLYGFFLTMILASHTVVKLIDERKGNSHQQLSITTQVKHFLFSFTFASSVFSPLVSAASLLVTLFLISAWAALRRNHEELKGGQAARLGQLADQVYVLVKSRLVERPGQGGGSVGTRGLDAADPCVVGEDRDESMGPREGRNSELTTTRIFRDNTAVEGGDSVDCSRDVMREMHAQDMGRIFEKAARRLISRNRIYRLLPEAEVNQALAEQVRRTEVLASQWMGLWQQGAHQGLTLTDIWRLLLDTQERALQNRLLMLFPWQRSQ